MIKYSFYSGKLLKWQLILYGVAEEPVRLKQPIRPKPLKPIHIERTQSDEDVSKLIFMKILVKRQHPGSLVSTALSFHPMVKGPCSIFKNPSLIFQIINLDGDYDFGNFPVMQRCRRRNMAHFGG